VMLKLQSTDKKESVAAKKTLEEMLKKDATNAAILAVRGYSKMLAEDFTAAETDLSAAIKKDPFLAFANKAFENRSLVYKKLGKADLAANDEKENAQFQQLIAFLAAA
jgi:Tfp pilus assembly protein PilF